MKNELLSAEDTARELEKISAWEIDEENGYLVKAFEFEDFKSAMLFVNKVGELAETENHHPDIAVGWGYAEIALTTHDVEGLTNKDFALARQIDDITVG